MFATFNENPAMTLQDIKETKRYGRTDARTDGRTDGQRENSIPPTNKVCGGYKFATFNENPAMTLQDIKETKRYGRTDARTDGRTDNVKTVYPLQTKFARGYNQN